MPDAPSTSSGPALARQCERFRADFEALRAALGTVIVGQRAVIEDTLIALFAGGHVLLEGLPGLGKTLLVKALAAALDLSCSRIQFTPDLMPADVLGTNMVVEDPSGRKRFEFQRGPIFAHVVLADEINRATPKTQSALLEVMQENTVTVAGVRHQPGDPFYVLATQNPIEMEGTFPLPEAQLDRFFFKIEVGLPARAELVDILRRTTAAPPALPAPVLDGAAVRAHRALARQVPIPDHLLDYAARLTQATVPALPEAPAAARRWLLHGASPRGAQTLVLGAKVHALARGGVCVGPDDLRRVLHPALRHRLILNFEAEAEGRTADQVLDEVVADVTIEA